MKVGRCAVCGRNNVLRWVRPDGSARDLTYHDNEHGVACTGGGKPASDPVVRVNPNTYKWKCPACHRSNDEGDTTCLHCGQDIWIAVTSNCKTAPERYLEHRLYPEGAAIQVVLCALGLDDWICQPKKSFTDDGKRLYELIREDGVVVVLGSFRDLLTYLGMGHDAEHSNKEK